MIPVAGSSWDPSLPTTVPLDNGAVLRSLGRAEGARYHGTAVSENPLLNKLNEQQVAAVLHFEGPALVVAGAGSGKTRTVVQRIAYLLEERGVLPQQILAVTFTNKAAGELRERVGELIGPSARDLWVATFHSACLRVLRTYGELIGLQSGFGIYDDTDQLDVLKEILSSVKGMADANPRVLRSLIDRAKSNLLTPEGLELEGERLFGSMVAGMQLELVADAYERYQARLRQANAVDFNDILGRTVELFEARPEVLERVRQRALFVHVDEYQDTNAVQYKLTAQIAGGERNLMVVGDPDQCLPAGTLVRTAEGSIEIEKVRVGDAVLGSGGAAKPCAGRVADVHIGRYRGSLWSVSANGRVVRGTPHHVVLARMTPREGMYYVYLMQREDRGYRIGIAKSLRSNDSGAAELGFKVRLNQEHGDSLWVLKVCNDQSEARYWEAFYAARFNLPTACFHGVGRKLALHEALLERLYLEVDTADGAKRLMHELQLHPDFPHHRAQNGQRRQSLNLVMFQDFRHGTVGYHRVHWSSVRKDIADRLCDAGYPVRSNGRGGYRFEASRKRYEEAVALARGLARAGGLRINRKAQIDGQMFAFMPLSHLHSGMQVLAMEEEELRVVDIESVDTSHYDGPVYDLEIENLHTYVADDFLVHNSIYAFRGADVRNILDFQKDYPDASVYRLELNYRSIGSVLELANALILHNQGRLEKELRPVKGAGEKVRIFRATDHRGEAEFVARSVERLMAERNLGPNDFAVLYRTNSQSRVLEEAMRRASIPAKIVGGVGFYERREVKDILSYARAALNPADDVAWKRILNRPKRGIGKTSEDNLTSWAARKHLRFVDALRQVEEVLPGTPAVRRIGEFMELMTDLGEAADSLGSAQFLKAVMDQSGYMQALKDEGSFDAQGRLENLEELLNAVIEWQEEDGGGSIGQFLDEAALLASVDDRAVKAVNEEVLDEAVTLMTLHNAKGLEFPVVFLVGLEENLIPHRSSTGTLHELEEERRLLYVGITRAQEELFLVHCESRMAFGRTDMARPSRFLQDVPKALLCEIDLLGQELHEVERLSKFSRQLWQPPSIPGLDSKAPGGTVKAEEVSFRGGEKVSHPKFGTGTVVGVSGEGPRAEITVVFDQAGAKRLLVRYANLSMA
jgi:DNA helicase-2/ATP-dependent DNA helicase PcrA